MEVGCWNAVQVGSLSSPSSTELEKKKKRGQFNVDMLDKFIGTVPLKKAKEDTLFLSKWD